MGKRFMRCTIISNYIIKQITEYSALLSGIMPIAYRNFCQKDSKQGLFIVTREATCFFDVAALLKVAVNYQF